MIFFNVDGLVIILLYFIFIFELIFGLKFL